MCIFYQYAILLSVCRIAFKFIARNVLLPTGRDALLFAYDSDIEPRNRSTRLRTALTPIGFNSCAIYKIISIYLFIWKICVQIGSTYVVVRFKLTLQIIIVVTFLILSISAISWPRLYVFEEII